ncbi:aminotransferase class I/II-fold pyridoxal phosphate-dependent enzyme [Salimicrobium halophilum]|uniref:Lysine decarboxylase n=1 Tax=Salimicrobium halophilum TaxID=86666 RepID=A0A1G8W0T4_9BACI|nr:aminotransferase class I/II-fold pyridoxal phosphate-dependent enzyme [Salimicrobium halophilum]SDJ71984.1 lysine decarboxylase [Salimicrobium halophilum]
MVDQNRAPLWEALQRYKDLNRESYHVPGHKNGRIFPKEAREIFREILKIDATEIDGLDDLHHPAGVIRAAEGLARDHFGSEETHFLVNGSTSGNLAMILAVCRRGSRVLVQRNAHKSVMHGLELAGVEPVFLSPEWEEETGRFSDFTAQRVQEGYEQFPDASALIVTYPDYFGRTYDLEAIVRFAHDKGMPVLVDEAHGVHFSLHDNFPKDALSTGADVVVQSAHKMAPAMTMGAYIHIQGSLVSRERLRSKLQVVQSSSPSYPILASLDLARNYLAEWKEGNLFSFLKKVREELDSFTDQWEVSSRTEKDDLLKVSIRPASIDGFTLASMLEEQGVYPEMATSKEVLLTFGLEVSEMWAKDKDAFKEVSRLLQNEEKHAKIKGADIAFPAVGQLDATYEEMERMPTFVVDLEDAIGYLAAEAVIPYPPGIPIVLKGERIRSEQVEMISILLKQQATFQNENIETSLTIFEEAWS